MRRRGEPGTWQRNVWALALSVFIAFVGFQFFSPFLPLYVRELGVTDPGQIALWSGVLSAVTPAVSGLLAPVFGSLADRFGRKLMLVRSLAGFTVIIGAMGLVTSVRQLFIARLVQGLFAGFSPMAMAVASVSAPRDKVSVAIGRVQSAQLLSAAVGPLAGGIVASRFGIRSAFFVTAGMCALALLALVALFTEARPSDPTEARQASGYLPLREAIRYPHFAVITGLLVIAQFIDRGLALLIPLRVAHLPGIEAMAATSGLIISVAAIGAATSPPTSTPTRRAGHLAGSGHGEPIRRRASRPADARTPRQCGFPELVDADANGGDDSESGDDGLVPHCLANSR